jgi:hypothetical protein
MLRQTDLKRHLSHQALNQRFSSGMLSKCLLRRNGLRMLIGGRLGVQSFSFGFPAPTDVSSLFVGDVVYVNVFGRPLIILNSYKASVDLMEKRSAIYSGRPVLTMASLYVYYFIFAFFRLSFRFVSAGWSDGVAFTTYNDKCRMYRRILHKAFNQDTVNKNYNVFIENEVLHCLRRFLETPQDFMAHVRRTAAAVVMKVTYGYDLQEGPDPFIKVADEAMEAFSHVSRPGAWVVDFVPICTCTSTAFDERNNHLE